MQLVSAMRCGAAIAHFMCMQQKLQHRHDTDSTQYMHSTNTMSSLSTDSMRCIVLAVSTARQRYSGYIM
jgi:hypothetical protein